MLGFVLGLLQMLLYTIYRKGNKKTKTNEKSPVEPLKSIAVVNPLGTGEVFPVEEDEQAAKKSQGDGEDKKAEDCLV